jgi:hypothetical protein
VGTPSGGDSSVQRCVIARLLAPAWAAALSAGLAVSCSDATGVQHGSDVNVGAQDASDAPLGDGGAGDGAGAGDAAGDRGDVDQAPDDDGDGGAQPDGGTDVGEQADGGGQSSDVDAGSDGDAGTTRTYCELSLHSLAQTTDGRCLTFPDDIILYPGEQGLGTTCDSDTCTGACGNLVTGDCNEVLAPDCAGDGLVWHGVGSRCADVAPCGMSLGACCDEDGTCGAILAFPCTDCPGATPE